ncbi:phosphoesterase family protein [Medicago truncatula]|uniref:Phosphoesterase family protein n=1 Tax=Medicago truncatula TaxID=3880 RepID=A0A072TR02_MEDTR|nr:phosphoesterase family protein [Medicago truncatula]
MIVTYDDSDGWCDHAYASPIRASFDAVGQLNGNGKCGASKASAGVNGSPVNGRCGPGVRIPFVVISPYAKQNYVDHTMLDQSSVVRFIEDNWFGGQRIGGEAPRAGRHRTQCDARSDHRNAAQARLHRAERQDYHGLGAGADPGRRATPDAYRRRTNAVLGKAARRHRRGPRATAGLRGEDGGNAAQAGRHGQGRQAAASSTRVRSETAGIGQAGAEEREAVPEVRQGAHGSENLQGQRQNVHDMHGLAGVRSPGVEKVITQPGGNSGL